MPEIRFARGDDADIAYTITGDGEIPLVYTMGFVSHLDVNWSFPPLRRFFESLGEFSKLIVYDKRGMGMSSRASRGTPLEVRMDDIRAVLDHAGIDRAAMLGESEGGPLAMLFAAAHPERTSHLILQGSWVRQRSDDDWAWGEADDATFEKHLEQVPDRWAEMPELWAYALFGRELHDPMWLNRYLLRVSINACAPRDVVEWMRVAREIDMREVAPTVRTPTLVLHCTGDELVDVENGRWLAEHIPGARYVERTGSGHAAWLRSESVIPDIREFLTGERVQSVTERVLATVLFTDLVGSTDRAARMGDAAWRGLLETHHASARREIAVHRGIEVGSAGDGFLARFDGPGRAIRCAEAIIDEAARHGLEVRAGVHTGEVELVGDDIAGLSVHIGARIAGMAGPGQILASGSVRDISAGSGVSFVDLGDRELRGVPGSWRIYRVDR